MGKALILGKDTKHLDKDIELCRTTNERISDQAAQLLIENQIPFTRSFIKIPFFLREKYRGCTPVLCHPYQPQPLFPGKTYTRSYGFRVPAQTDRE